MKLRQGFVSNSSSSSYTCSVCGWSEYLWEPPYGFRYCCGGHGLCEDCYDISDERIKELSQLSIPKILECLGFYPEHSEARKSLENASSQEELEDVIRELAEEDELSQEFCPICNFEIIEESDLKRYLIKISKITAETVFQHIKAANKRRKKLYDKEYIAYVCGELGVNTVELQDEIKSKFTDYNEFQGFLR